MLCLLKNAMFFFSCYASWSVLFSVVCVFSPLGINHVLIINLMVHLPVLSSFSKIYPIELPFAFEISVGSVYVKNLTRVLVFRGFYMSK